MSGQLETVKKIEPIYKSPDKWDTHLAMHVKRGMQGSWDKRKSKNALTPYEYDISNDRYAPRAFNHACVGLSGTFGNCSPGASFVGSPPRTRDKFVVDFESVKYRPYTLGMADQHDADAVIKGSDHGWLSPTKSGY